MESLQIIKKLFNDILTCKDNKTFDCGRLGFILSLLTVLVLPFYMIYKGQQVDLKDVAIAISGVAAAFGWHIKLKQDTEPGQ